MNQYMKDQERKEKEEKKKKMENLMDMLGNKKILRLQCLNHKALSF